MKKELDADVWRERTNLWRTISNVLQSKPRCCENGLRLSARWTISIRIWVGKSGETASFTASWVPYLERFEIAL